MPSVLRYAAYALLYTVCSLFGSWVLYLYWGWFIQPAFGIALSFKHTIGVSLTIGLELSGVVVAIANKDSEYHELAIIGLIVVAIQLAIAFAWHLILT
jgi:ATP/ADP translocase